MRRTRPAVLAALAGLAIPGTGEAAGAQELPWDLRGRVEIAIRSCQPHAAGPSLLRAELEIRTGSTEVQLQDLQCGAFRPGSDEALFLNPVAELGRIPPHSVRRLWAVFPFDARHTQCRCVVRDVRQLRSAPPLRELPEAAPPGAGVAPPAPAGRPGPPPDVPREDADEALALPSDALRRERVLVPSTPLRSGPGPDRAIVGTLDASSRVEVLGVRGGWKWVRVPGSALRGWIPDDASTSDVDAPERVAGALENLRRRLAPGRVGVGETAGLCEVVSVAALRELVFALLPERRAVYVTSLWHALSPGHQDAFQIYANECYGITRIVDVVSGEALRDLTWGDRPGGAAVR